jgi:hypothetical protein
VYLGVEGETERADRSDQHEVGCANTRCCDACMASGVAGWRMAHVGMSVCSKIRCYV